MLREWAVPFLEDSLDFLSLWLVSLPCSGEFPAVLFHIALPPFLSPSKAPVTWMCQTSSLCPFVTYPVFCISAPLRFSFWVLNFDLSCIQPGHSLTHLCLVEIKNSVDGFITFFSFKSATLLFYGVLYPAKFLKLGFFKNRKYSCSLISQFYYLEFLWVCDCF